MLIFPDSTRVELTVHFSSGCLQQPAVQLPPQNSTTEHVGGSARALRHVPARARLHTRPAPTRRRHPGASSVGRQVEGIVECFIR